MKVHLHLIGFFLLLETFEQENASQIWNVSRTQLL
jgi:hypothetical protein